MLNASLSSVNNNNSHTYQGFNNHNGAMQSFHMPNETPHRGVSASGHHTTNGNINMGAGASVHHVNNGIIHKGAGASGYHMTNGITHNGVDSNCYQLANGTMTNGGTINNVVDSNGHHNNTMGTNNKIAHVGGMAFQSNNGHSAGSVLNSFHNNNNTARSPFPGTMMIHADPSQVHGMCDECGHCTSVCVHARSFGR
jgi:hypothetical protein